MASCDVEQRHLRGTVVRVHNDRQCVNQSRAYTACVLKLQTRSRNTHRRSKHTLRYTHTHTEQMHDATTHRQPARTRHGRQCARLRRKTTALESGIHK